MKSAIVWDGGPMSLLEFWQRSFRGTKRYDEIPAGLEDELREYWIHACRCSYLSEMAQGIEADHGGES